MEATQTEIENPQPTGQEDGTLDSLAEGIMEQMENRNPNYSGEASATKPAETSEETTETTEETTETSEEEADKYTIKWQGQDKEVTQAELLDLAQKGFDYTQKTQALAQERDNLAPIQGLVTLLKSDPVKAAQIAAIISGQALQAQPRESEKPKFDDPIEQLSYDIEQRILAKTQAQVQQSIIPLHRQQALNQVRSQVQADPDYQEVHAKIIEMVKAQPPAVQKTVFLQLDQDPQAYLEAFQHFKNQKAEKPTTTTTPKPVRRETHAPILESGGVEAPSGIEGKAKTERISKMKAKALRDGNPVALADWLKASGAIDHLY